MSDSVTGKTEKELKILKERKNWVELTKEQFNFDIEEALTRSKKPIKTRSDIDDRIKLLAVTIRKAYEQQRVFRRSVYQYFVIIREAAEKLGFSGQEIRKIAEEIFREFGVSEGHIRRIIPYELKHHQYSNIRYRNRQQQQTQEEEDLEEEYVSEKPQLTNIVSEEDEKLSYKPEDHESALNYIKQLEAKIRRLEEQLENSIIIGQETRIYSGTVPLDNENVLPVRIAINLKENRIEYLEIDTDTMRKAAEETVQT